MDKPTATVIINSGHPRLHRGECTASGGKAVINNILLSVPDHEFETIRPHLEFEALPHHCSLYEPNRKVEFGYFLNAGMVSLVFTTRDGESVEVGVVGNEGFSPVSLAAGIERYPHRAQVQIAGDAFKLSASALETILPSSPQLQKLLNRYAAVHQMQVAQTAGCNRLHNLEQRLARWLLLTQDRVESALLRITHDFLATMLGTDRPSVSLAASALQTKGIISIRTGP